MNRGIREATSYRSTKQIVNSETKFGLKSYGEDGKFRSSYEHAFAVYVKELGIKFEFEKHGEPITMSNGLRMHYIPDFYLPEYNLYIEIVNNMDRRLARKMYLFNEQNQDTELIVLDKQHLRQMFDSKFTLYDIIGKPKGKKRKHEKLLLTQR